MVESKALMIFRKPLEMEPDWMPYIAAAIISGGLGLSRPTTEAQLYLSKVWVVYMCLLLWNPHCSHSILQQVQKK